VEKFLEKTIKHIFANKTVAIDRCCFIVPNRRTAIFLKKHLSEIEPKAMLLPDFLTIDEFVQHSSGIKKADNLSLLTDLYKVYSTHTQNSKAEAYCIDDFMAWGQMLLSDFSDIDTAMADAKDVFGYLSEAKAISIWNLNEKELTPFQKNYLKFYNTLYPIYKDFTSQLLKNRAAYQALIFRYVAENNDVLEKITKRWVYFYFIGFNAFTQVEEIITDFFLKRKNAELFFDYDTHFIENKEFEAGYFIKRNIKKYGKSPFHESNTGYTTTAKNVNIIGVPQNIGQAKLAGLILKQKFGHANIDNTALILPQEDLLFPVLNSLPEELNHINVTMGYPLQKTLMFDLFSAIINLYDNSQRIYKLKDAKIFKLNIRDLIGIIENPYFKNTYIGKAQDVLKFVRFLKTNNKVYYSCEELNEIILQHLENDSPVWHCIKIISAQNNADSYEVVKLLKNVLSHLLESVLSNEDTKNNLLELDFLYHYSNTLNRLSDFLESSDSISIRSLKSFHQMLIGNISVPFSGEPLKGLQIMGLLESRNLDFENIIILSVNEGILPKSKTLNSFIPYDIRKHFKMAVYNENEAIYAYYFYRLLQRAKNIYLLYNTEHDVLGSTEKSRYITQILNEWKNVNPALVIKTDIISASVLTDNIENRISIKKEPHVFALLKEKALKGFSPSSLSVFKECSLRFYFQYLLGLKAEEEPDENADAAILGSAVHDVLENIYATLTDKALVPNDLIIEDNELEKLLRHAFAKNLIHADMNYGKNHLLFKIAIKYIQNFLNHEKENIQNVIKHNKSTEVIGTEVELQLKLEPDLTNCGCDIFLKGKIDRIDKVGNEIRIIDYKTGRIDNKDLKLDTWESLVLEDTSSKLLQLLIYGYLYRTLNKQGYDILPCFISLRTPRQGLIHLNLPEGEHFYTKETHQNTETFLKNLFLDLFDTTQTFHQTSNLAHCKYCDFTKICNR